MSQTEQLLQRGRALEGAEIKAAIGSHHGDLGASTGPRLGRRGDKAERDALKAKIDASTGPRLGRRGDPKLRTAWYMTQARLQRGRALEGAEINGKHVRCRTADVASTGPRLGRRGDDAPLRRRVIACPASTGPRLGRRGDPAIQKAINYCYSKLQRGRALEGAEMSTTSTMRQALSTLQRGRALEGAEIPTRQPSAENHPAGFNGAAPWKARR